MIKIILSSFLVTLIYTPFGIFFHKGKGLENYSLQLIFGLIIVSFYALTLNFFLPLNIFNNSTLIIISIIIIFLNRDTFFKREFLFFCLISTLIIFLLITNSNVYRPDAGLYHLPYISLLNEEKIIIGNANLHFRFGHTSIIQYLSAVTNNIIFGLNGIVFPSALIASAIIINFLKNLMNYLKLKKLNFHFFFLLSIFIFITYKMNRYSEYGNDAPAHFLMFLLLSEIIKNFKNIKSSEISNYFILAAYIIMNKIILLTSILLPFIFFIKKKNLKNLINGKIFFLLFFLLIWSAKNILVSGCFIYPVKFTCIEKLVWSDTDKLEKIAIENEAWAKGWPEFRVKNSQIKKKEFSSSFFWLNTWLKNHFLKILNILSPYILFLIVLLILFRNKKNSYSLNNYKKILSVICVLGIMIWFYKVPNFRYGYSNIIILFSLIFSFFACQYFRTDQLKKLKYLIVLLISIFVLKNINRIIFDSKEYYNYPWPRFYSFINSNKIKNHKYEIINNKKVFFPDDGYCMYSKSPCGEINEGLKIRRTKGYLMMFIES